MTHATARIAIAGSGCVLPSGWGVDRLWSAALEGRSAISPLQSSLLHSERVVAFGHVSDAAHQRSRQDVAQNLQRYCPPAVIWGVSAVRQALAQAGHRDLHVKKLPRRALTRREGPGAQGRHVGVGPFPTRDAAMAGCTSCRMMCCCDSGMDHP